MSLLNALLRAALYTSVFLTVSAFFLAFLLVLSLRFRLSRGRPAQRARLFRALGLPVEDTRRVIGFFHPYCNAGGGGERVLWTALAAMQKDEETKDAVFVVYTGDVGERGEKGQMSKEGILARVLARFDIDLDLRTLHFVPLPSRYLVHDSTWPRFTLIGQSLGSVVLAWEGLAGREEGVVPDYWIDTMGYAFAYPLIKYLCPGVPMGSYTHYPTISTDMLRRIRLRQAGHTNPSRVARSWLLSNLKLGYYTLFASLYSWSLSRADVIMVNSTWTHRHVASLLSLPPPPSPASTSPPSLSSSPPTSSKVRTVYPPCDTSSLSFLPLSRPTLSDSPSSEKVTILSLAQFRPEKEHPTQLLALSKLFQLEPSWRGKVRLVCAGSVRGKEDEARVESLKSLAGELGLTVGEDGEEGNVKFEVNKPWEEIRRFMGSASVGLHTMVDEHFGITVVEFQAAGLLTLAHASAGPLLDILVPYSPSSSNIASGPTGFLAPPPSSSPSPSPAPLSHSDLASSFALQLRSILLLPPLKQLEIRARGREAARERFGESVFEGEWGRGWRELQALGGGGGEGGGKKEQ
ncbi:hypothetical protein JCM8547_007526 [Rhodosporidiobolus lusitaniae]